METSLHNKYYSKESGLREMQIERSLLKTEAEIQVLFELLIEKGIVNQREIYRCKTKVYKMDKYMNVLKNIKMGEDKILNPPINHDLEKLLNMMKSSEQNMRQPLYALLNSK